MTAPLCRFCAAPLTQSFIDLGATPLANSYLSAADLEKPEARFPLHARVCTKCFLVQVDNAVPPDHIFSDYAYFSSYSAGWVEHARLYAEAMIRRYNLGPQSQVVEIASNDGYLLQHFAARGIPVLGVEPAANVAEVAVKKGIPTEVAFFGTASATRLKQQGHAADLMAANNVLAHVPDPNDFVAGFAILLKPTGVMNVEFPHLLRLMEQVQFDTIYHEHYSYLSLLYVEQLFARHGLAVHDVEELTTHGGSLRLHAAPIAAQRTPGPGLAKVRADEARAGLDRASTYAGFQPRVEAIRAALLAFLRQAKAAGKTVAAYGAAAKGNTLLNFCGIGPDLIAYVVDRSTAKQGRYLPGSHIPVFAPERLAATRPDYVLILPWNLQAEIMHEMAHIRDWGGRFVVAIPAVKTLD